MTVDRYVKVTLTIIAVALGMMSVRPWLLESGLLELGHPRPVHAQELAKYEVTLPKSWGKFVAFSNNNLLLEASDHTMRIIDVEGKSPEYPKVKVLIHWQ